MTDRPMSLMVDQQPAIGPEDIPVSPKKKGFQNIDLLKGIIPYRL
jgi:hypothetical protein